MNATTNTNYLTRETRMLDYSHKRIQELITKSGWLGLSEYDKILDIYNFVRDTIRFGYNESHDIPASEVLKDGYGHCNTKGTLFMALLRGAGIPCRFHGFTIDKKMQKGAMSGIWYILAPNEIIHSWVEVFYNNKWINMEGFILDIPYLTGVQKKFADTDGKFCGFAVATDNLQNPSINWRGEDTYIQKEGIIQDFGTFNSPDDFYALHQLKLNALQKWLYHNFTRKSMNANVARIREV